MELRKSKILQRILLLIGAVLLFAADSLSQDPGSRPVGNASSPPSPATPADAPGTALKNVLAAACAQDHAEFVRYLTVRNREAFSRMTPAARLALMKRFVLLNEPGKATASTNPAGRPIVRCETPDVTTEMQIGGADLGDNIAFLPMEIRDAADTSGNSVHRINMGLVRENGDWKLLSLGLLLLDLPALEVEWDAAEMEGMEQGALEALKRIAGAVEAYRNKYLRLPDSLAHLGPPVHGAPSAEAAGLVDSDLANGIKNGYAFRYVIAGASTLGALAKYELAATPLRYGRTGRRSFFRDTSGTLHAADRQGSLGHPSDPKVE